MVASYTHHNVWERITRSGVPIRTSFFKDEVPNENATYTVKPQTLPIIKSNKTAN